MLEQFKPIRLFVLDVDGVLTNGQILLLDDGQQARSMNIKDGYALQLAIKKGYQILVISGGQSTAVSLRLNKLGIESVQMGVHEKADKLKAYIQLHQIEAREVLYMGDDLPDYAVMKTVGLPCCPADAVPEIKSISTYISVFKGGEGCVRDVIEKVLKLNGHWDITAPVYAQ